MNTREPLPTRAELERRARERWNESIDLCGLAATDEAREQAGLPDPFVWSNLTGNDLFRLAVALRVRIMQARP